MDPIMDLVRQAALIISGINKLPDCLKGITQRETITKIYSLLVKTENHLLYEANWVQARYSRLSAHEGYLAWLKPQILELGNTIQKNLTIQEVNQRHIPDLSDPEGLSVVMRLWAGCLDAAKLVREKIAVDGDKTAPNPPDERAKLMQRIHQTAQEDAIYAAGVPVGPYAKRHKPKPEPETVVYTGIPEELQQQYFLDDIEDYPGSPGAIRPEKGSG